MKNNFISPLSSQQAQQSISNFPQLQENQFLERRGSTPSLNTYLNPSFQEISNKTLLPHSSLAQLQPIKTNSQLNWQKSQKEFAKIEEDELEDILRKSNEIPNDIRKAIKDQLTTQNSSHFFTSRGTRGITFSQNRQNFHKIIQGQKKENYTHKNLKTQILDEEHKQEPLFDQKRINYQYQQQNSLERDNEIRFLSNSKGQQQREIQNPQTLNIQFLDVPKIKDMKLNKKPMSLQSLKKQFQKLDTRSQRQLISPVLISINKEENPFANKNVESIQEQTKPIQLVQSKSQRNFQKQKKDKLDLLMRKKYQMYEGKFNRNELINVLMEQKIVKSSRKHSKKSGSSNERQRAKRSSNQREQQKVPHVSNNNQLECIIQDILSNNENKQNSNNDHDESFFNNNIFRTNNNENPSPQKLKSTNQEESINKSLEEIDFLQIKNEGKRKNNQQESNSKKNNDNISIFNEDEQEEDTQRDRLKLNQPYDIDIPESQVMLVKLNSFSRLHECDDQDKDDNAHLQEAKNKKVTIIKGERVSVIKRQKLEYGDRRWPRVKYKAKNQEELKIQSSKKKQLKSAKSFYIQNFTQDIESDEEEFSKLLLKEIKVQTKSKRQKQNGINNYRRFRQEFQSRHNLQFGEFSKMQNELEKPKQLIVAKNHRKQTFNKVDYDTKSQIMMDDRFKPIERIEVKPEVLTIEYSKQELDSDVKMQKWHTSLNKKITSLLEMKELRMRQVGKLTNNAIAKKKQIVINTKPIDIDKLTLKEPRRAGSLKEIPNQQEFSKEELFECQSEKNFVQRHIIKYKGEKYKQLLQQKKQSSQYIGKAKTKKAPSIIEDFHILKIQQQTPIPSAKNVVMIQNTNMFKEEKQEGNKIQKKIISKNNSSIQESSFEYLSSSFDPSEEIDKVVGISHYNNDQVFFEENDILKQQKNQKQKQKERRQTMQSPNIKNKSQASKSFKNQSFPNMRQYDFTFGKRGETIVSKNQLFEIENNMQKKEDYVFYDRLNSLKQQMEQGIICAINTQLSYQVKNKNLKKGYPEDYINHISKLIIVHVRDEININLLKQMNDSNIAYEQYLYNDKGTDKILFNFKDIIAIKKLKLFVKKTTYNPLEIFKALNSLIIGPLLQQFILSNKGIRLSQNYLAYIQENHLCNYEGYIKEAINFDKLAYIIAHKEKRIEKKYKRELKQKGCTDDLINFTKAQYFVLYGFNLGAISFKQILDALFLPFDQTKLYNKLYKKQYWIQLDKNKQKILIQYHNQLNEDDIIQTNQNDAINNINANVNRSLQKKKQPTNAVIISSRRYFRYQFAREQSTIEYQLLNKFVYYSVVRRITPTVLGEIFLSCINPSLKGTDQIGKQGESDSDSNRIFFGSEASFFINNPNTTVLFSQGLQNIAKAQETKVPIKIENISNEINLFRKLSFSPQMAREIPIIKVDKMSDYRMQNDRSNTLVESNQLKLFVNTQQINANQQEIQELPSATLSPRKKSGKYFVGRKKKSSPKEKIQGENPNLLSPISILKNQSQLLSQGSLNEKEVAPFLLLDQNKEYNNLKLKGTEYQKQIQDCIPEEDQDQIEEEKIEKLNLTIHERANTLNITNHKLSKKKIFQAIDVSSDQMGSDQDMVKEFIMDLDDFLILNQSFLNSQQEEIMSLKDDEDLIDTEQVLLNRVKTIEQQKTVVLNVSFKSDGELIQKLHQKVDVPFNTPRVKPSKKGIDNLLPDYNKKKKQTRLLDQSVSLRQISTRFRKSKKKNVVKFNSDKEDPKKLALEAIKMNNAAKLNEVITRFHRFDLDDKDEQGNSLLSVATQFGSFECVEVLLKNGVNVNTQNNTLNTPMHYAKSFNFRKIFDLLIMYKADQSITNSKGKTPWEGTQ